MDMKRCPKCGCKKPLGEFFRNRSRKDGFSCYCKSCHAAVIAEGPGRNRARDAESKKRWRQSNRDRVAEMNERYRKTHRAELAAKRRDYYRRNPEKVKTYNARWTQEHPEMVRQRRLAAFSANPEKYREIKRRWARAHPENAREKQRRRRARLKQVPVISVTEEALKQRLSLFGNRCWICGGEANAIDHVKPIAKGGAHMLCNLRPICQTCNSKKRDIWPFSKDMIQSERTA